MTSSFKGTPWKSSQPLEIVGDPLGGGSFGKVWKALHKVDESYYAIKQIHVKKTLLYFDGDVIKKMLREVTLPANITSPFVIKYNGCWLEDSEGNLIGTKDIEAPTPEEYSSGPDMNSLDTKSQDYFLYIQMELCQSTLKDWIQDHKSRDVSPEYLHEMMSQMASGLNSIHTEGIIHRDLKPANIFWKKTTVGNSILKIGDFGLSIKISEELDTDVSYRGTDHYRSPEMSMRHPYTNKTDIFSLGLIFLEILYRFSNTKEKAGVFFDLQNNRNRPDSIVQNLIGTAYPKVFETVSHMLNPNPEDRPDANQVIKSLNYNSGNLESKTVDADEKAQPLFRYPQFIFHDEKIPSNPFPEPIWILELILYSIQIEEISLKKLLKNVRGLFSFKFLGAMPKTAFSLNLLNLPGESQITKLTFKYVHIFFDGLPIDAIKGVRSLKIWMCEVEEDFVDELRNHFPALEYIEISGCVFGGQGGIDGENLKKLMELPALKSIFVGPWTNPAFNKSINSEILDSILASSDTPKNSWSPLIQKDDNGSWLYAGENQLRSF